jgi:hypothetical protein
MANLAPYSGATPIAAAALNYSIYEQRGFMQGTAQAFYVANTILEHPGIYVNVVKTRI